MSPVLDPSAVWAFRNLAERQDAGRLFVTTTARLLRYPWVRDCLEYSVSDGAEIVISIKGVSCPVYGRLTVK